MTGLEKLTIVHQQWLTELLSLAAECWALSPNSQSSWLAVVRLCFVCSGLAAKQNESLQQLATGGWGRSALFLAVRIPWKLVSSLFVVIPPFSYRIPFDTFKKYFPCWVISLLDFLNENLVETLLKLTSFGSFFVPFLVPDWLREAYFFFACSLL